MNHLNLGKFTCQSVSFLVCEMMGIINKAAHRLGQGAGGVCLGNALCKEFKKIF